MGLCLKYNGIPCDSTRDIGRTVEELIAADCGAVYGIRKQEGKDSASNSSVLHKVTAIDSSHVNYDLDKWRALWQDLY